jgi:Ca2+-binding RTX toxin-like protein
MIDRKRNVMHRLMLAALVCAFAGCAAESDDEPTKPPEGDDDEVGDAIAQGLGVAVMGCANSGWDEAESTLTLTLGTDAAVLSAPGGKLTANGYVCTGTIGSSSNVQLTTTNIRKIKITGTAGANKFILDNLPGSFGTRILGNMGGIEVDYSTGGADAFMIRGGVTAENYKFAKDSSTTDLYLEITGDKVADIKIIPTGGAFTLTASMGGGTDSVNGSPAEADITSFAGGAITVAPIGVGFTAYGGAAIDTFQGGTGADTFYGGEANDIFKMAATADGADTYIGDEGLDTVDYSNRTMDLNVDIGPAKPARGGSVNLSTLDWTMNPLGVLTLIIEIDDGGMDRTVTFANPTSPLQAVSQINATMGLTGVASLTGNNRLLLTTPTNTAAAAVEVKASGATSVLGLAVGATTWISGTSGVVDADDGLSGENDDVRTTTENITGGSGNDVLIGDGLKNSLKGGNGNDQLSGGTNTVCDTAADGDTLLGENGDDTFYSPGTNCFAVYTGGMGTNAADFSGRTAAVFLSNNGMANDGAMDEKSNVASDITKLVGGNGADTLTGGIGNDILIGGPGGDTLSGGMGTDDIVDYSGYTAAVNVSLCFTTTVEACPAANDGIISPAEGDQVHLVEHIIGTSAADTMTAPAGAPVVDVQFEGRGAVDTITGGDGNDLIWGDDGDDVLKGGLGDDNITGGAGADTIWGEGGDGDICITDASDMVANILTCEIR